MTARLTDARFSVIDIVTTGLYPSVDRILEIAVVETDASGAVHSRYETLVNPRRGVGTVAVHGITTGMVESAPEFRSLAWDLLGRIGGSIWVGHNMQYILRFLAAEYERLGYKLPANPSLCIMGLYRALGPSIESHRLPAICEGCGVDLPQIHSAGGDAEATTRVLGRLLAEASDYGIENVADLDGFGLDGPAEPAHEITGIHASAPGPTVARANRSAAVESVWRSYIGELVDRLTPSRFHELAGDRVGLYANLLDRLLADRRVADHQPDELERLADEWMLTANDIHRTHDLYTRMMIHTALCDGDLSDAETADLMAVARFLSVPYEILERMVINGRRIPPGTAGRQPDLAPPAEGIRVSFTGEISGPDGTRITRREAALISARAGLVVQETVDRHLAAVVVSDADIQSFKARKARAYGVGVMMAADFWRWIGSVTGSPCGATSQ